MPQARPAGHTAGPLLLRAPLAAQNAEWPVRASAQTHIPLCSRKLADGFGQQPPAAKIEIHQKIIHQGEVNRCVAGPRHTATLRTRAPLMHWPRSTSRRAALREDRVVA